MIQVKTEATQPKEQTGFTGEVCRICSKPTRQVFRIGFGKALICIKCEAEIVKQSIANMYE